MRDVQAAHEIELFGATRVWGNMKSTTPIAITSVQKKLIQTVGESRVYQTKT